METGHAHVSTNRIVQNVSNRGKCFLVAASELDEVNLRTGLA